MKALGKAFHKALDYAETEKRLGIDRLIIHLVIVTGDVAETAKPKEFDQGVDFLESLAGELGLETRWFVFVPGNHDVSWPECKKIAAAQEEEEFGEDELRRRMDEVKFRRYQEFLHKYYGIIDLNKLPNCYALKKDAYLHDFPDLQISVAALNSCERESYRSQDHRGQLSVEQAQALMDAWRDPKYRAYLKIVAVHHNPVVTTLDNIESWSDAIKKNNPNLDPELIDHYESDIVGFSGRDHLKTIVKQDVVQLVLHGHHHAQDQQIWPSKGQGFVHVLSTGSFSLKAEQLPGDEPPSAQLILLSPGDTQPTLRASSLVYEGRFHLEGEILRGGFVPDPAQPDAYEKPLDLPPDFKKTEPRDRPAPPKEAEWGPFVRTYRKRLSSAYALGSPIGWRYSGRRCEPTDRGRSGHHVFASPAGQRIRPPEDRPGTNDPT